MLAKQKEEVDARMEAMQKAQMAASGQTAPSEGKEEAGAKKKKDKKKKK